MIIVNKPITIKNSNGITINKSYFCAHTTEISNNAATSVKVRSQLDFFIEPQSMFESPTNALNIEGFDGIKKVLNFDYFVKAINGHYILDLYDFDLLVKERLLKCFPDITDNDIEITTTPIVE